MIVSDVKPPTQDSGPDGPDAEGTGPAGVPPKAPPKASGAAPDGPRNPWHAPDSPEPRKSATLEDILRLKDLAKRGTGSGGPRPQIPGQIPGMHEFSGWLPLVAAGIAIVWLLASSIHQLGSNEQGIITTFGKYSTTIGPGVSLSLPWPVQNVTVTDVT